MARTKPSTCKGPGGMICRQQLATRDSCLPWVVAPVAPTAITAANVERNEACVPVCTAAAAMLRYIPDPVDGEVLEGALGQIFAALDQTDWESHVLFCPLGFGVLLWSGFLEATDNVSLQFARQAQLLTWGRLQC